MSFLDALEDSSKENGQSAGAGAAPQRRGSKRLSNAGMPGFPHHQHHHPQQQQQLHQHHHQQVEHQQVGGDFPPQQPVGHHRKHKQHRQASANTQPRFDPISGAYVTGPGEKSAAPGHKASSQHKAHKSAPPAVATQQQQPQQVSPTSGGSHRVVTRHVAHRARKEMRGMESWIGDAGSGARFQKIKRIGSGANGDTFLASDTHDDNKRCVAKVMNTKDMDNRDLRYAFSEIRCLTTLQHPFIIGHMADYYDTTAMLIVTEYAEGGDLEQQISQRGSANRFKEHEAMFIFLQLAAAVHRIHVARMLHRDIKSANVFLTSVGIVKLGDFGYSQSYYGTISDKVAETFCGTPCYLSPEVWEGSKYSKKADAWSLGVVLYELLFLRKPFASTNINDLRYSVLHDSPSLPESGPYSAPLMRIVKGLMMKNPDERSSTRSIFMDQYVRERVEKFKKAITSHPALSGSEKQSVIQAVMACVESTSAVTPPATPASLAAMQAVVTPPGVDDLPQARAVHFCSHGPIAVDQSCAKCTDDSYSGTASGVSGVSGGSANSMARADACGSLLSHEPVSLDLASVSLSGDTTWQPCTMVYHQSDAALVIETPDADTTTVKLGEISNACPLPTADESSELVFGLFLISAQPIWLRAATQAARDKYLDEILDMT